MPLLVDTNVAISLRHGLPPVLNRIAVTDGTITISLVTLFELEGGLRTDPLLATEWRKRLDELLVEVQVLPLG